MPKCGRCVRLSLTCDRGTVLKFRPLEFKQTTTGTLKPFKEKRSEDLEKRATASGREAARDETSVVSLPKSLLPSLDPNDAVRFYSHRWDWRCLPSVVSVLKIQNMLSPESSPIFTEMMTALSASHLSRTTPKRRLLIAASPSGAQYRPDPSHETISHEFYGTVMRKMAKWSENDFGSNPILGLLIMTLFCLVESSMGSFKAFWLHSDGATKLIQNYAGRAIAQDSRAGDVLASLVEVRLQMWWRRVYFGTPEFHRSRPTVVSSFGFNPSLIVGSQRIVLLMNLCESHRIHNAAIIAYWDGHAVSQAVAADSHTTEENATGIELFESLTGKLQKQSKELEAWYSAQPSFEILNDGETTSGGSNTILQVPPVELTSHREAMDFAYYLASRVLQTSGPVNSLSCTTLEDIRAAYVEVESWIQLLLRVVAGISWQDCVRLNMYTIGITGVLLACILRSHDPSIGIWCEQWLQKCLDGKSFEEGSFPAFQTLQIIRLVNEEREKGFDVFSLFQTVEDGGGSGKLGSYQSQALSSLLAYSRCRTTGRLHSYHVSI